MLGAAVCAGARVADVNTRIGYITQQANLFPWFTLRQNVEVPLLLRGVAKDDIAAYVWISHAIARRPNGERRDVAVKALETVARRLAPEQIREAQNRSVMSRPASAALGRAAADARTAVGAPAPS